MTGYDLFIARQLTPSWLQSIQHLNLILEAGWVGGYGSLEVLGDKFLPKQSRLFDEDAESSECREGGGETLLSVTQAIGAGGETQPASSTHSHSPILAQHLYFSKKNILVLWNTISFSDILIFCE